jgi:hypothetical protein
MAKKIKDVSGSENPEGTTATVDVAETAPEKRTPVKSLRDGDCSVSIWHRVFVVKGKPTDFYSLTFERSYRKDGDWKYTKSFSPDDLPRLIALCQQAETAVAELRAEDGAAQ